MMMVLSHINMPVSDVARFEVSFTGNSDCFVARLDFPAHRGGGYQVFEGILGYKVSPSSPVMGKNRVTPRFHCAQRSHRRRQKTSRKKKGSFGCVSTTAKPSTTTG